jgi:catechol 2,3-dioxygenase-like lactoylglutathione lyase family enzyme
MGKLAEGLAHMDMRLSFLTLGVADFERARKFYEGGLGWKPRKVMDDVAFYEAQPGFVFALYPRHLLAEDAGLKDQGSGFGGITLAINQSDEAGVDATIAEARAAGATVLKPPQKTFWGGYHGYFADLDGHAWEVAHNPGVTIDREGRTVWKT